MEKKLVNPSDKLFGPKSTQSEENDNPNDSFDDFCGTIEFNQYEQKIDKLLESGLTKEQIIKRLPKKIQKLMKYFDKNLEL